MGAPAWPEEHLAIIADEYPKGGVAAVRRRLNTKRSDAAIRSTAARLGAKRGKEYQRQPMTPQLLSELNKAYRQKAPNLKALAEKHGVNVGWLKYQARTRGIARTAKSHRWAPQADQMLQERCEGLSPSQARRLLSRAGYFYPLTSVAWRMQVLKVSTECTDAMTPKHIAQALGIDDKAVRRWLDTGRLKPWKRDNALGQPHHYTWVKHEELRAFLIKHPGEIDLRRIPPAFHHWFIDLLANRKGDAA